MLVEGFKHEVLPKIELHRPILGHPLLCSDDQNIIAIAHDQPLRAPVPIPSLDLNDADEIAQFVTRFASAGAGTESPRRGAHIE